MADNVTTPVPAGTVLAAKDIAGIKFVLQMLADPTGVDAIGAVASNPAANTLLGRLKAIADAIASVDGHVDGLEGLATTLNGLVDGLEALGAAQATATLQTTANATLTTIAGYLDTVETLLAGVATSAKQDLALPGGAPFTVVPHASNPLPRTINALSIVTGGTVVFRYPGDASDTTVTLPAGFFPLRATHIRATSTAANMTGW